MELRNMDIKTLRTLKRQGTVATVPCKTGISIIFP
jgi:hypothetical protein